MDEPQSLGFSRDTDCMSLTSASASVRRCAGSDLMKLETLAWVAFVLFSVIHALRFGNGNKLPGCAAFVNRPFSPARQWGLVPLGCGRREIQTGFVVIEKQPTSIAIGWSEQVCGRGLHPPKSNAFHGRTFSSTDGC